MDETEICSGQMCCMPVEFDMSIASECGMRSSENRQAVVSQMISRKRSSLSRCPVPECPARTSPPTQCSHGDIFSTTPSSTRSTCCQRRRPNLDRWERSGALSRRRHRVKTATYPCPWARPGTGRVTGTSAAIRTADGSNTRNVPFASPSGQRRATAEVIGKTPTR
jgi:hypothetical protein